MHRVFVKRAMVVATVAFLVSALAGTAYGAKPVVDTVSNDTTTIVVTDLCAFHVTVEATISGKFRLHFDSQGNLTVIQVQVTEQDTFIANGNTVVGSPYHARGRVVFDAAGNVTESLHGVFERIRLPDGTKIISAGHSIKVNAPPGFTIVPDRGHTGNVGALCAALAA